MGTNFQVEKCTCPSCKKWRKKRTIRHAVYWGGAMSVFILAIGLWTYHNALEFARLHEGYNISIFP